MYLNFNPVMCIAIIQHSTCHALLIIDIPGHVAFRVVVSICLYSYLDTLDCIYTPANGIVLTLILRFWKFEYIGTNANVPYFCHEKMC